jgi:hypothetical protein
MVFATALNIFDKVLGLTLMFLTLFIFLVGYYIFTRKRLTQKIIFTKYPIIVPVFDVGERHPYLPSFIPQECVSGFEPVLTFHKDVFQYYLGIFQGKVSRSYSEVSEVDASSMFLFQIVKVRLEKCNRLMVSNLGTKRRLVEVLKFFKKKGCKLSSKASELVS